MAYLLILCDPLQEWDRPLMEGDQFRRSLVVSLIGKGWKGIDSDSLISKIVIRDASLEDGTMISKSENGLCIELHFKADRVVPHHPALTWTSLVFDLQGLHFSSHLLTIKLVHPINENDYEMDLFQSFLREKPEYADLREWVSKCRE